MGTQAANPMYTFVIMIAFIAVMYFFLIKPQKKKDRETQEMRDSIRVGDEIVTIGGICGKVVKTKDESIVIQTGADKTKMEFKKWAVSSIEKKAESKYRDTEAQEEKKARPKRLGKKAESMEEEAKAIAENTETSVVDAVEEVAEVVNENE